LRYRPLVSGAPGLLDQDVAVTERGDQQRASVVERRQGGPVPDRHALDRSPLLARRIVDDQINSRRCFKGSDVSTLAPMMRPFISSFGRLTTETVLSATYSPA
jgi:hypothetical protein